MPTYLNTDTLAQHVVKLNQGDSDIGSRTSLTTSTDSNIVSAINSLVTRTVALENPAAIADASTSSKGISQFSSDNFAVSSGTVTIKNLGIVNAEIATDTLTSNRFNSVVNFKVYDSSGSAVKTLFSPGS